MCSLLWCPKAAAEPARDLTYQRCTVQICKPLAPTFSAKHSFTCSWNQQESLQHTHQELGLVLPSQSTLSRKIQGSAIKCDDDNKGLVHAAQDTQEEDQEGTLCRR